MKKLSKLQEIKNKFYYVDDKPDLNNYGVYRIGLLSHEIENYLRVRANKLEIKKIVRKFNEVAGANTMGITPDGKSLMYRWDIERFADLIFKNKKTYFD